MFTSPKGSRVHTTRYEWETCRCIMWHRKKDEPIEGPEGKIFSM